MSVSEELYNKYGYVMSVTETASVLRISRNTVYRYVDKGFLKTACKGTKIDTQSVIEFIEGDAERLI